MKEVLSVVDSSSTQTGCRSFAAGGSSSTGVVRCLGLDETAAVVLVGPWCSQIECSSLEASEDLLIGAVRACPPDCRGCARHKGSCHGRAPRHEFEPVENGYFSGLVERIGQQSPANGVLCGDDRDRNVRSVREDPLERTLIVVVNDGSHSASILTVERFLLKSGISSDKQNVVVRKKSYVIQITTVPMHRDVPLHDTYVP